MCLSRGDFCPLLITFANSMHPDQARQNVGPDLGPNCLTLDDIPDYFFFSEKVDFEKKQQTTKNYEKLPSMQRVKHLNV